MIFAPMVTPLANNGANSFGVYSALMSSSEDKQSSMTSVMISSMLAGMLARVPCHPIDTAKAQMQASNAKFSLHTALLQSYKHNGIRGLYAGFGAAFVGSAPASCLYFTTYEASKRTISSVAPNFMFTDSTSGLIAETVSCLLWVPIDVIKERLQVQRLAGENYPGKYTGSVDALVKIFRTEGLRGVYRGYGATIASYGPFSAIYLSSYEQLKVLLVDKLGDGLPAYFIAGGIAGGVASWITSPLDLVKVRLQIQRRAAAQNARSPFPFNYQHTLDGLKQVWASQGLRGLFKGAGARVAYATPSAAVTISLFDGIKHMLSEHV